MKDLELYFLGLRRALEVVKPFSEYVNIPAIGGTPEDAIRKEFGL